MRRLVRVLDLVTSDDPDPEHAHSEVDEAVLEFVRTISPAVFEAVRAIQNSSEWWVTA